VLTAFGGSDTAIGRVVLLQEDARPAPARLGFNEWMASGIVAAILVAAAYFILNRAESDYPQATADPSAVSAPTPEGATPTAADAAPAPDAAPAVIATPVAAPTGPAPGPQRALIELPSETQAVVWDQPVAKIWVRRRGGLRGEVTFVWWTESGSAKVDRDFRAISPRTATIDDGAKGVELLVPLLVDPSRQQPRTFYVKIDGPGSGATLGERTLMQVSIVPPG
jgi:hypothetical protein